MLLKTCAVIVAGLIAAPAFAGLLIFSSLTPEEARQIKRLAVVSATGDTVHGKTVGLTIFQNKSFDASLPDWHIDAAKGDFSVRRIGTEERYPSISPNETVE